MPKITKLDPNSVADQFSGEMIRSASPYNIAVCMDEEHQVAVVVQNNGQNFLILPNPEVLRLAASALTDVADRWERGEHPGMVPPKKEGE